MSYLNESGLCLPYIHHIKHTDSPRGGIQQIKYPSLVQHCPQPSRLKFIKGLLGNHICSVESEEWINNNYQLKFPPNNFEDAKLRNKKINWLLYSDYNPSVSARPNFDTINSLKYFTGLQNTSFKNKSYFNLKRVPNLDGWEEQLKTLTICALEPFANDKTDNMNRPKTTEVQRKNLGSSLKELYSPNKLSSPLRRSRSFTSPSKKLCSRMSSSKSVKSKIGIDNLDLDMQVFNILGGILQTADNEVIKTWLLTATEREKALIVDILRSALFDKEEFNFFVKDPAPNTDNQIIYTPNKSYNSKLMTIPENSDVVKTDYLLVHSDHTPKVEVPPTRPPTASIFRPISRENSSVSSSKQGSVWIPSESIVVN